MRSSTAPMPARASIVVSALPRRYAEIPFVVEAWAEDDGATTPSLTVCVNRTPVTGEHRRRARQARHRRLRLRPLITPSRKAPNEAQFDIWLNITTPYMPITSDGKAPDLTPFLGEISNAAGKAVRKAHRPKAEAATRKRISCSTISTR